MRLARPVIAAVAAVFVLLPTLATGADPEIACRELLRQRTTVTVMGADGSNPTVIFENDKFKLGSTWPSWSPGGEWIAFLRKTNPIDSQVSGIYKIRPNGEEPTQILCAAGTGRDDVPFTHARSPKWSPDGQWILLLLGYGDWGDGEWLGIVSENGDPPGASCHSDLIHLYSPGPWDPESATGWVVNGESTPWNHDGSKIAFFELYVEDDIPTIPIRIQLKVLDIEVVDDTPTVTGTHAIALPQGLQDLEPGGDMDWQRDGGTILIFDTNDGLGWLDLDLDGELIRSYGHLTDGWSANWSPNNDRIVYNLDLELRVASFGYDDSGAWISDSTVIYPDRNVGCLWPNWQRDAITDCGDGTCEGAESPCTCAEDCGQHPLEEAPLCTDAIDNDCDGYTDCDDDDCSDNPVCQAPFCGDGFCDVDEDQCTCAADCGTPPSSEVGLCTDGLDNDCDFVIDCEDTEDCADDPACTCGIKGDPCSSGADCCSGLCHPVQGVCK